MLSEKSRKRYDRQIRIKDFGERSQELISNARVAVVGAGGLGCPALLYLCAAGVGEIGIIDGDKIELSNLQRQVLYGDKDIGKSKSEIAVQYLKEKNIDIKFNSYNVFLDSDNAAEILSGFDIIIDGTDNFPTRYLINDVCELLGLPWVYGSVFIQEGQISTFNLSENPEKRGPSYRCLFPVPPDPAMVEDCNSSGVIGVLPGTIGVLQATEAIKIITGNKDCLNGKLFSINAFSLENNMFSFERNPFSKTFVPSSLDELKKKDYQGYCGFKYISVPEINSIELDQILLKEEVMLADIRQEFSEDENIAAYNINRVSKTELSRLVAHSNNDTRIVVICQRGISSKEIVKELMFNFPERKIYSLIGGINELAKQLTEMKTHE